MEKAVFLAFDLGASNGRAMVGELDLKNMRLEIKELYRFPNGPVRVGEHLYWDVLRIWGEVKTGIKLAYKEYAGKLLSIGVDTWGIDFALLDNRGELLGNPHTYRDPRTRGLMEEVLKIIPRERIYERTGIQFIEINTLYQLYSLAKNDSSQLKAASLFLMIPDLFNYWLSGARVAEYTEATTTQFLDPRDGSWCFDILEELGIPTHMFPRVVKPATKLGKILPILAEELGVPKDIEVVAPATHDTASAIAAAPIDRATGYVSSGTWSLVGVELDRPLINTQALEYNFTNEGGAFDTITFLRNIQGMWFVQEIRRILREKEGKEYSYGELTKMAAEAEPFKAFIDPDDPRFIAPLNMIEEIMRYLEETGQEKPSGVGGLIRLVFESLALKYRLVFEQAMRLTGRRLERINIFGGGSRNWLLNQLTADFTGLPVEAGPEEATSIGNVLLQAAGLGIVKSLDEIRDIVRNSFELKEYQPRHSTKHEDAYSRFLDIVEGRR